MKSIIICAFLIISGFSNMIEASDSNHLKIKQKIYFNNNLIIVAEDNSIWELFCFDLRSQTWSEWWNNVKITIKNEFNFDEKCWQVGDLLNWDKNDVGDSIAENFKEADKIKYHNFPFLIINQSANKIAFARQLSFEALIQKLICFADDQYKEGYNSGYSWGHLNGYNEGYNWGYSAGSQH